MAYELRNTTTGRTCGCCTGSGSSCSFSPNATIGGRRKVGITPEGAGFFHMDAVRMSAALSRALLEIPHSYADGYTEEERLRAAPLGESRAHPSVEQSDPLIYFSRPGRDTLERFIRIASGA